MPSVIINNLFKVGELARLSHGDADAKHKPRSPEDEPLTSNRNVLFERKIIQIKCKYQVVSQFADQNYFLQIQKGTGWDIYWTDKHFLPARQLRSLMPYQRINYFPGMAVLTNKQNLTQRLNLFRVLFPEDYDFFPATWVVRKNATPTETETSAEMSTLPGTGVECTRPTLSSEVETESMTTLSTIATEPAQSLATTATEPTKTLLTTAIKSTACLSITESSSLTTTESTKSTVEKDSTAAATTLPSTSIFSSTINPDKFSNSLRVYDENVSDSLESRPSCDTAPRIGSPISNKDKSPPYSYWNTERSHSKANIGLPNSNANDLPNSSVILANSKENITKRYTHVTNHVKPLCDITNLPHVQTTEVQKNNNLKIFDKREFSSEENSEHTTKRVDTEIIIEDKPSANERDELFPKEIEETKNEIIERIEKPDATKTGIVFNTHEKLKKLGVRTNIVALPNLKPTSTAKSKWLTAKSAVNKMQEKQILLKDNVKAMIMALNRVGTEVKGDEHIAHKRQMPSYGKTFNRPTTSNKENKNTNDTKHIDTDFLDNNTLIDKSSKEVTIEKEILNISQQSDEHSIKEVDTETESDDTSDKVNTKNAVKLSKPQVTNLDQETSHTADIEIESKDTSSEVSDENVESITESNVETSNKSTELHDASSEFSDEPLLTKSDEETKNKVDVGTESGDTSSDISDDNNESEPNVTNEETSNNAERDTDDASSEFSDENESEQCVTVSDDVGTRKSDTGTDSDDISNAVSDKKDIESEDTTGEVSNENESDQHIGESDTETIHKGDTESDDVTESEVNAGIESDDTSSKLSDESRGTEAHGTAAPLAGNNPVYILKPCDGCQGKGIQLATNVERAVQSMEFDSMICQEYITNPLLWNGYKFDIRFYVLITSVKQLRVYVYNEGIVRLATEKYEHPSETNMRNMFMHLTNYSINKSSENFRADLSKQSLGRMNAFLQEQRVDLAALYDRIHDMIVKTILTGHKSVLHAYLDTFTRHVYREACFQLLGFDILLDDRHTPYLLEINKNASLKRPTPVDKLIKTRLTRDLFSILNLNEGRLRGDILRDNLSDSSYRRRYVEHEMSHRGDFSLIYPRAGHERYEKYMIDDTKA